MKQCPKCNATYANDKQKFCTKDGTVLVDALEPRAGQDTTIRIDSAQLDDEITKVISQPLPRMTGSGFDPYKTQVSTEPEKTTPPPPTQPFRPPASVPAPTPSVPPPAPSGPIAPASTAAAPPAQSGSATGSFSGERTIAAISAETLAPRSVPPTMAAAVVAPQPAIAPAKKRSKLPLVLGILFVLLFIGAAALAAGYFFVLRPVLEKKRAAVIEVRDPQPPPIVASTPGVGNTKPEAPPKIEAPPYSPPADAVQFVNSNAKLDGKLAEHYVEFSFYYPKNWQKDPKAGVSGASNFAKVERRLPPDFTQENFAVGWYSSTGSEASDRVLFPTLAENLSKQFAKGISDYKKVSEGPAKAGVYDGYEFRFESVSRNTEHGDIKIWGRVMFVPPADGSNNGVTLLMLTTSLAPELRSVDDVGVKGELPMMLESFRFGK